MLAAAVSVLLALITAGSTVAACLLAQANHRAEDGRRQAETARAGSEANARSATADFELAYQALDTLITTTQKQMAGRPGLLPVRRQLLKTAAAGLKQLARGPETGEVNRLMIAAHDRLGDLYFELGRTPEALAEFRAGLAMAQAWSAREPDNPDADRGVANAHDKLGAQASFVGDNATAADHYRQAAELRHRLAGQSPTDRRAIREWSVSLNKLGDIELAAGRPANARDRFSESLRLVESLTDGVEPQGRWADIWFCYVRLVDACIAEDDLVAAEAHARTSVAAARELRRLDPTGGRREACAGLERTAIVSVHQANLKAAAVLRRKVVSVRREVVATDPENQEARRNLYVALALLGETLPCLHDLPGARRVFEERKPLCESAPAADPGSAQKELDLAACYHDMVILEEFANLYAFQSYRDMLRLR